MCKIAGIRNRFSVVRELFAPEKRGSAPASTSCIVSVESCLSIRARPELVYRDGGVFTAGDGRTRLKRSCVSDVVDGSARVRCQSHTESRFSAAGHLGSEAFGKRDFTRFSHGRKVKLDGVFRSRSFGRGREDKLGEVFRSRRCFGRERAAWRGEKKVGGFSLWRCNLLGSPAIRSRSAIHGLRTSPAAGNGDASIWFACIRAWHEKSIVCMNWIPCIAITPSEIVY
jgi:hypothetical protein